MAKAVNTNAAGMKWGRQPNAADKARAERQNRKMKNSTISAWVTGDAEFRIGFVLVGIVLFLGILSIFYTPHDVYEMDTSIRSQAPSLQHFFGTDNYGRDIFSRAMVGASFTLLVSGSTVLLATAVSIILGLVCGYVGGMLDEVVMRVIDAINSFPSILIALVMVSILNYGKLTIIPALVIMFILSELWKDRGEDEEEEQEEGEEEKEPVTQVTATEEIGIDTDSASFDIGFL